MGQKPSATARGAASCAGEPRRLPTEAEYEKAARGDGGLAYPWGNTFEADKLNSAREGAGRHDAGRQFVDGASPYGVLDVAGNVFQWTSTPFTTRPDDREGLGVGGLRAASGAARRGTAGRSTARHVIVGFRCARRRACR